MWNKIVQAIRLTGADIARFFKQPMVVDTVKAMIFSVGATVVIVGFAFSVVNYPTITGIVCVGLTITAIFGKLTLMTYRNYRKIKGA